MNEEVPITCADPWFKVTGMLEQNWATIEPDGDGFRVYFLFSDGRVFDSLPFAAERDAMHGLINNRYERFAGDPNNTNFVRPPRGPFFWGEHPNGNIYSSGRYWR